MNDLRFACRQLMKNPGFTAVAVLTLALGIGASTAVFSLMDGVMLTPPPYPQSERLVLLSPARTDRQPFRGPITAGQCVEWQQQAKTLEGVAGYYWIFDFLVLPDGSASTEGLAVAADYFKVTGLKPSLGRTFAESEVSTRQAATVILGHRLWQQQFHGDPGILGQTVTFSRFGALTVIGVMPPGVRFLPAPMSEQSPNYDVNGLVDFWVPESPAAVNANQPFWNALGRLRPDASLQQCQAELTAIAARQAETNPRLRGTTARVVPLGVESNRESPLLLIPLFGAVLVVWLIASGNVAALLLARGLKRHHEICVRSALGAGRLRLARQFFAESLLLALLGGGAGLLVASTIVRVFVSIGGGAVPRLDAVGLSGAAWGFSLVASLLSTLIAGIAPAWRAATADPAGGIGTGAFRSSVSRTDLRALRWLTIGQLALTLSLLIGAGLLARTLWNLNAVQPGYRTANLLTMLVTFVEGDQVRIHREAIQRIEAIPGVKAAAFGWGLPLTGNRSVGRVSFEGLEGPDLSLTARAVTSDFFAAMDMRIVEGREFRVTDDADAAPVVIVNRALADRYFQGGNPLGRQLRVKGWQGEERTIIGIVANVRADDLSRPPEPELYLPLPQATAFSKHLLVRTEPSPLLLAAAVQRALRSLSPSVAIESIKTMEQHRADSMGTRLFAARLIAAFALAAIALALVSVYGVIAFSVGTRRREFAIRQAVGALPTAILALILRDSLKLIGVGVALGILLAVALSRALASLLFGVSSVDPVTLLLVPSLFALIALTACWLPARRATRIDPLIALRAE